MLLYNISEHQKVSQQQTSTKSFNYFGVVWDNNNNVKFQPDDNPLYIDIHLTQDCMPTYTIGKHTIIIQKRRAYALPAPQKQPRVKAAKTSFEPGARSTL